jgi:hypothetical protein
VQHVEQFEIVRDRLWQAGSPLDWALVTENAIDVIIDVNGDGDRRLEPAGWFRAESILYVFWPLTDGRLPDETTLELVSTFVADLVEHGKRVLVQCSQGVNRSALVSALVARRIEGLTGPEAIERVLAARPSALSNPTFRTWLATLPAHERPARVS